MKSLNLDALQAAKDAADEAQTPWVEYMRVAMNGEMFLLAVSNVLSVIRPLQLTPVPMAPDHLLGVANARGQIFCIIDPGKALRLPKPRQEETANTRFILLRHPRVHLGIWVDEVLDLVRVLPNEVEANTQNDYTSGTLKTKHGVLPILRVEALFE